jgi:hypothetical protein
MNREELINKIKETPKVKAGDFKLIANGKPFPVDCRVLYEGTIESILDFLENHQEPDKPTEHESMSEGVEMELVALNILNRTFTFLAGEESFDVREGKYLIKRIDQ